MLRFVLCVAVAVYAVLYYATVAQLLSVIFNESANLCVFCILRYNYADIDIMLNV